MARDEVLMQRTGSGASPPTMRLYQWTPPTISLGYFQHYSDYEKLPVPAGDLPVVRRPTGGGAILHDRELTYSITVPASHPLLRNGPNRVYELAHDAVIACLADLGIASSRGGVSDDSGAAKGPFFCFERRHGYDLLLGTDKIVGSAQRRTARAVLQHGSIVLGNRFSQQPTARIPIPFEDAIRQIIARFPRAFAGVSGMALVEGHWSDDELSEAEPLIVKHRSEEWLRRR
jgi:lipoate-protein ligase A